MTEPDHPEPEPTPDEPEDSVIVGAGREPRPGEDVSGAILDDDWRQKLRESRRRLKR